MLDDEERGDTELRNQFKERWTRTVSASLTVPLREEAKKYMDIIQNAINADKIVQEKYRMNRDCIVLLSKQTVIIFSARFELCNTREKTTLHMGRTRIRVRKFLDPVGFSSDT
jgi:hypothetical protein